MNENSLQVETTELESQTSDLVEAANGVVVNDTASVEYANDIIFSLDKMKKQVVDYWRDPKDNAHQAWKGIVSREKEMLTPIDDARKRLASGVNQYLTEERRRLEAEQRKADAERRRREEEERKKIEAEAEKALDSGDESQAEKLLQEAESYTAPADIVQPEIEKTVHSDTGTVSQVIDVHVEVVDLPALCREIAEGRAPENLVKTELGRIKTYIKVNQLDRFPGLRIEEVVSARYRGK